MMDEALTGFCLVGGTALSLQLGHRESIDIDLFSDHGFDSASIAAHLTKNYCAEIINTLTNGVFGFIKNVKVDIISHQYPWLRPLETHEGIRMPSLYDIAAMKMHAIVQNGTRLKDFIDLYKLLEQLPLEKIVSGYKAKYPTAQEGLAYNSLLYHEDIDFDEPIRWKQATVPWPVISERFKKAVDYPQQIFSPYIRRHRRRL